MTITIILIICIGLIALYAIIQFFRIMGKQSENGMTEEEYQKMSGKAKQMMSMVDPLTGLPYTSMTTPKHIEFIDERFSENNKEDDLSGQGKK